MEGLRDNKPLLYSIVASGGAVLALATGIFPDLSNMFEIVYFPPDVSIFITFIYICSGDHTLHKTEQFIARQNRV